jgi:cytochrome c biogenesis protein ResB
VRLGNSETGDERDALIHMNKPFDYRGYRFFQTSVATIGSARTISSGGSRFPVERRKILRFAEAKRLDLLMALA